MIRGQQSGMFLSAVFVDYDNIYLSLKRKSEEAAKRFAKDAGVWIKAIETGSLITPTNGPTAEGYRRIVMNRCYGNPVPRRNQNDNSTDMSSFPFVRHHFLRSGFEIVDCPPLTAQLKNSSDIRMVMDVRDSLTHATTFDEFVILSGDADFTPVLHRLRAHARRTVIFANDHTAAPYSAISDGEIREADLITLLLEGRIGAEISAAEIAAKAEPVNPESARREILADVTAAVRAAQAPVPLEVLADRAVRLIGHDKTIGTGWGGAGGFRELLAQDLPDGLRLSGEPPYVVVDTRRHLVAQPASKPLTAAVQPTAPVHAELSEARVEPRAERMIAAPAHYIEPAAAQQQLTPAREAFAVRVPVAPAVTGLAGRAAQQTPAQPMQQALQVPPQQTQSAQPGRARALEPQAAPRAPEPQHAQPQPAQPAPSQPSQIQNSIARIHEACQAPPLAPPEYRMLFEVMAQEINENGLIGAQTIVNIAGRAQDRGIEIRRDDVRFVLEVVSEADPWFEQGASANLFAGRFRNFVVARCRSQGLNLSADELDLVEAWFAGNAPAAAQAPMQQRAAPVYTPEPAVQQQPAPRASAPAADPRGQSWSLEEGRQYVSEQRQPQRAAPASQLAEQGGEDFPRIVRTRLRG